MGRKEQKETGMMNASGVSYAELIRKRRKEAGMNQEQLGAMVRVQKNAVGAWESGRSRPDLNSVPVICEALGLSLNEFFGIRERDADRDEAVRDAFESRYLALSEYHRKIVLHEMDALLGLQEAQGRKQQRTMIRLFRNELSACAGPSFSLGESRGEEVWIEKNGKTEQADELIRVNGDSMEPEYHDGDYVLVRHGASVRPGEVGIFTNGDAGYIKVYQRDGLHSLNPVYRTIRFQEEDEVRCVGKVIGIADPAWFARESEEFDRA